MSNYVGVECEKCYKIDTGEFYCKDCYMEKDKEIAILRKALKSAVKDLRQAYENKNDSKLLEEEINFYIKEAEKAHHNKKNDLAS